MRKLFNRFIAGLLLAAFSVFLVPGELVHALYGHEDTRENSCIPGAKTVGAQHVHCSFLSFESPVYTHASVTTCPVSSGHSFAFTAAAPENAGIVFSSHPSLRGPPALV